MCNRQLRGRVYIQVGSREKAFDPAQITQHTGINPTKSWKKTDLNPRTGLPRTFDYWSFEQQCDAGSSLGDRTVELHRLAASNAALLQSLEHLEPVVQYAIETGREPTEFTITSEFVKLLADHHAEIDCDLYWISEPSFDSGLCMNCRLEVPSTFAELMPYIGGEARAAELRIKLALFEVANEVASRLIESSDEGERRLGDGLELAYLPDLKCAQFSSDFVPTSGYIEDLSPERWMEKFLTHVEPYVEQIGSWSSAELVIRLIERGDFQGTAGLHFDNRTLERLRDLEASLSIRLAYIPEPLIKASGVCFHCDVDLLAVPKTD